MSASQARIQVLRSEWTWRDIVICLLLGVIVIAIALGAIGRSRIHGKPSEAQESPRKDMDLAVAPSAAALAPSTAVEMTDLDKRSERVDALARILRPAGARERAVHAIENSQRDLDTLKENRTSCLEAGNDVFQNVSSNRMFGK